MRINDAFLGGAILILGILVVWWSSSFPAIPGQDYGAATFPVAIGWGLIVTAAAMIVTGVRQGVRAGLAIDGWARSPLAWARVGAVIVLVLCYVLFSDRLGFLAASTILLLALMLMLRVPVIPAFVVSLAATLVIHQAFAGFLRVPLPIGSLPLLGL